ncbi:LLM class flavin-dependent oxidoreductase [Amycolatopsis alba]|uniref:LLM class flavin-dependent oxidoreductase n=1 Tax=Amycolatopsis alba TaxID=76020 RepID=UPI00047DB2DF|nr:LLM class flavin-dependent oxidoreductase [Amycolatopsis alba]
MTDTSWTGSLHTLSGGRFELGIGTGRPGAETVAAGLKRPFGTGSQRLAELAATVDQLTVARDRPPLLISGAGPKVLDLAARKADIISPALPPLSDAAVASPLWTSCAARRETASATSSWV